MTPIRRKLITRVMNDSLELLPVLHQLSRYKRCDNFLKWLIKNRITGQTLIEWLRIEHSGSVIFMVQFMIKHQYKNKEYRPIILGKDWA